MPGVNASGQANVMTAFVYGVAVCLLVYSAGKTAFLTVTKGAVTSTGRGAAVIGESQAASEESDLPTGVRPWQNSVVQVTYPTDGTMCNYPYQATLLQGRPVILAGALLNLIDIVAGVAARRHAGQGCVTVSVDSVLFLSPIHLGDLIHLSAAVNRSFGSSMEIGVRVTKEDPTIGGVKTYVSHAYMTFALRKSTPEDGSQPSQKVPRMIPETHLQWRRHFLAGHRRARRLAAKERGECEDGLKLSVRQAARDVVMNTCQSHAFKGPSLEQEIGIEAIERAEKELLARALYGDKDETLHLETDTNGYIVARLTGEHQEIRQRLSDVESAAKRLGIVQRSSSRSSSLGLESPGGASTVSDQQQKRLTTESVGPISILQTTVQTMHIVFPQHANSHSILFGGHTMRWMEEAALMSVRHLIPPASRNVELSWRTVCMDSLEFRTPVRIGDVMTFSAVCTKAFGTSCEVYVVASAERHDDRYSEHSPGSMASRHFTNDALFTIAVTPAKPEGSACVMLEVVAKGEEESTLHQFAEAATQRRRKRLELRDMLMRIYAAPD